MNIPEALVVTLLAFAIEASGLQALDIKDMPPIQGVTEEELSRLVCPGEPGGCRSVAALFDTEQYRILVRSSLNLQQTIDRSFLVHEFVHVLQFRQFGEERFSRCQDVLSSEREAYAVQNAYLRENGVEWQEGRTLRYMQCPPEQ